MTRCCGYFGKRFCYTLVFLIFCIVIVRYEVSDQRSRTREAFICFMFILQVFQERIRSVLFQDELTLGKFYMIGKTISAIFQVVDTCTKDFFTTLSP